jgi:hypothetical protein
MRLALSFYLCVVCGWLTIDSQTKPASNGAFGVAFSGMVIRDVLSGVPNAAIENSSRPDRGNIERQIDETEKTLNGMKRPLNAEELKSAAQIRNWITWAREALKNDDLDGANTLSAKAHALLLELCKECRGHSEPKAKLRPI